MSSIEQIVAGDGPPTVFDRVGVADSDASVVPSAEADAARPSRPAEVPEQFWDEATGGLRGTELLSSFLELERRLEQMVPVPQGPEDHANRERLFAAIGRPEKPEDYRLEARHELVAPDAAVNKRLHEAGLSEAQAQLVYDLAAEVMLPILGDVVERTRTERETDRLVREFGGRETWARAAEQLRTWSRANLDEEAFRTLSSSAEGVLAMYQIMRTREPALVGNADALAPMMGEQGLHDMVRDPRYWRDRDPDFVARVTAGFQSLYRR